MPSGRQFYDYCPKGRDPRFCSSCARERAKESRGQHRAAAEANVVMQAQQKGFLTDIDRFKHVYMPGKTGFGKSTLLFWMAAQDIFQGKGVCVIDPKGDLVRLLLDYIPETRKDDVLWLDLETPVALDFMDYEGEREKERLIGELRFILTKQESTQHAPLMSANIQAILHTILNFNENPETPLDRRATFLDIERFLVHERRRDEILAGVTSPKLIARWRDRPIPQRVEADRILTRTNNFSLTDSLSKIFDAPQPKLNIARAMEEKKVLLVNIGGADEVQQAYATLLVSKIRDAAYRRANPAYPRTPYFLYCDEFQEFQTSDFDKMLSMARGFGLGLTLAHQYVHQLQTDILHSIKGNVSTFIVFNLGGDSIASLRTELIDYHELPEWEGVWLRKIPTFDEFDAIYRGPRGHISKITVPRPVGLLEQYKKTGFAEYIKKRTVDLYSSPTLQVSYTPMSVRADRAAEKQTGYNIEPGPEPRIPEHREQTTRPRPRR